MYESLLFCHSWIRWIVLIGLLMIIIDNIRSELGWRRHQGEKGARRILLEIFAYQIGFGVALYMGSSPFVKSAFLNPALIHESSVVRYWTIIHGPLMLISILIFAISKKLASKWPKWKIRILTVSSAISLALIFDSNSLALA